MPPRKNDNFPNLFEACIRGNIEDVQKSINSGESLVLKTVLGFATPMSVAAWFGHKDLVQFLIEKYPDMVEKPVEKTGKTPIMLAKLNNHDEVVRLLEGHLKKSKLKLQINFLTVPTRNDYDQREYPLTPNCAFSSNPFSFNEDKLTAKRRSKSESRPLKRSEIDQKLISILKASKMAEYIPIFQEQEVDFKTFLTLNQEEIISIGITEASAVSNILKIIELCKKMFII